MKPPEPQSGAMRKSHRGRVRSSHTPGLHYSGVMPQDEWCEDVCHDTYDIGSDEHEDCLDWCREE